MDSDAVLRQCADIADAIGGDVYCSLSVRVVRLAEKRKGDVMDQVGKFVADAVLGIDTLWGGAVMCASCTGRFIADSWFSDEPLPHAYTVPAAAAVRSSGGVG